MTLRGGDPCGRGRYAILHRKVSGLAAGLWSVVLPFVLAFCTNRSKARKWGPPPETRNPARRRKMSGAAVSLGRTGLWARIP